ncbi:MULTISPECIES: hypothetical protein [unclassified Streptomyces]|uniref:hypothetical protein n=1 Tax=unclassified Streptomyces TaxID=2593676 RepID=UPI0037A12A83
MPITGSGDDLRFHFLSDWRLNAVTGEWKVGKKNNHVLNPSFEADQGRRLASPGVDLLEDDVRDHQPG